ncbi:MAG: ATP-binding protein [Fibrobacterota bacterium]
MNILIIEDEKILGDLLASFFRKKGHSVDCAVNGDDGVRLFNNSKRDVVLLDIMMPKLNGIEVLKEIKTKDPLTEVIMITGNESIETAIEAVKYSAFAYIRKPFKISDINNWVNIAFEKKSLAERNIEYQKEQDSLISKLQSKSEELKKANEELRTFDQMKNDLLSNVSHELRTPLVSIKGYTEIIYNEMMGGISEEYKKYLGISLNNIDKLIKLIDSLLDYSRIIRDKKSTLEISGFMLRDLITDIRNTVAPEFESKGISLSIEGGEKEIIEADRDRLSQLFLNLLSNALKFSPKGEAVELIVDSSGNDLFITVRDRGIGIDPKYHKKIFTHFYQIDSSSTRKYSGTGIGLSIVKEIAELHGGSVSVKSVPEEGAEFGISIPVVKERK